MSITYNPITNFTAKDTMGNSNPSKVLSGVPFDAEFNAISAAFQLSAPSLNPVFTGTVTTPALSVSGEATVGTLNGSDSSTWDATSATVTVGAASWDESYGWGDHGVEGYATETFVTSQGYITSGEVPPNTDTTYTGGINISVDGTTINMSSNPLVSTVILSNGFIIDQTSTSIVIKDGVTNLMELDENGNLTVIGNITAYGSV